MGIGKSLKRFWKFLWEDDSILSWIVNIVLAFVVIKFLLYPGLGLALHTDHPVVAVVSGSMEHGRMVFQDPIVCGNEIDRELGAFDSFWQACGSWYEERDISSTQFREFPFVRGINKGDVIVLYGTNIEDVQIGDVVVFGSVAGTPIIHRVVAIDQQTGVFQTKGDRNADQIVNAQLNEKNIPPNAYVGRAVFRIPFIGYVKVIASEIVSGLVGMFT